jgi:hypothetical protein
VLSNWQSHYLSKPKAVSAPGPMIESDTTAQEAHADVSQPGLKECHPGADMMLGANTNVP